MDDEFFEWFRTQDPERIYSKELAAKDAWDYQQDKIKDLKILVDANKEMADKMEFQAKKFGIKLKLAILLLNEAAPIMEKHYLRKRWFEQVNELNKKD